MNMRQAITNLRLGVKAIVTACAVLSLLWGAGTVQAQNHKVPIGESSYRDTVTGRVSHAFGAGPVTLNYKDQGQWKEIIDDWEKVGQRQVWRSVRGTHRVWADSTGAAIYARGNHYLGTKTVNLVKFNTSDSSYVTKKSAAPDSVTVTGNQITFWGIFPGIDKRISNNPKVFQTYTEEYIFRVESRDSIAGWGPWAGHLLGIATRLDVDSLNLGMRDAAGIFSITRAGRISSGMVELTDADTAVFATTSSILTPLGGLVVTPGEEYQVVRVIKRVVLIGGVPYIVELFDPVKANQLYPEGDLIHALQFGNSLGFPFDTVYTAQASIENTIYGTPAAPATSGTLDSIVWHATATTAAFNVRAALYDYSTSTGTRNQLDTCVEQTIPSGNFTGWVQFPAVGQYSMTGGTTYGLYQWGANNAAYTLNMRYRNNTASPNDGLNVGGSAGGETFGGFGWDNYTTMSVTVQSWGPISMYGVYSEPSATSARRRRGNDR